MMALWLFFTGPSSGCWRVLPKYDNWKCLELSIPPTLTSPSAQSDLSQWPTRMGVWKSGLFALSWDDLEVYLTHQSSPVDQRRVLSMTLPTYPPHLASPLSYPLHFLVCFFCEFLEKSTCTQILMSECTSEDLSPRLSAHHCLLMQATISYTVPLEQASYCFWDFSAISLIIWWSPGWLSSMDVTPRVAFSPPLKTDYCAIG